MIDNQFLNFFKEAWYRIGSKSPKFFFVTKVIGLALALAGKLPWALNRYTNIEPSQQFINLCSDVGWVFTGVFATSLLPTQSKAVAVTESGDVVKKTDTEALPFTATSEAKVSDKQDLPTIDNIPK